LSKTKIIFSFQCLADNIGKIIAINEFK